MDVLKEKEKAIELTTTTTTEQTPNLFWDYVPQEAVRAVQPIEQDGANCGCFAAAMAIATLLGKTEDEAEDIAHQIQQVAELNKISSIGELFNADALTAAVNTFCTDLATDSGWKEKLLAKTVDFTSEEGLVKTLAAAKKHGVRVLIAYYAGNGINCDPAVPTPEDMAAKRVKPEKMYYAHWAVANLGEGLGERSIILREGNKQTLEKRYDPKSLFDSNDSLGDTFSWDEFLKIDQDKDTHDALLSRKGLASNYTVLHKGMPNPFGDKGEERVNLRGKLVLIGKEKI